MRCCYCLRNIAAGAEAQKMVVEYEQSDGTVRVHGYMMADGPISAATGTMKRGAHAKCWWAAKKREAKGDVVSGRVVAGTPTVYDIGKLALTRDDLDALGLTAQEALQQSTDQFVQLSAKLARMRVIATQLGKGIGDAQVQEAFLAAEHGGPYAHQHHHRLETYQLIAHLEYAHGITDVKLLRTNSGVQDQHAELHAKYRQELVGGAEELSVRDWRTQSTVDL